MKALLVALATGALALSLVACGGDDEKPASSSSSNSSATAASNKVALDTAFGTGGIANLALNPTTHDRFMAVATAPDGKVYAAGFIIEGGDQLMAVARIDSAGKLDTTFGTNGIASVNAAPGGKLAELARSIAIQSSGKIIIGGPIEANPAAAGDAGRDTDIAVARFDNTGKLDTAFGTNGVAKVDLGPGRITTGTTFVGDTSWGLGTLPGDKVVVFGSKLADGADRTDTDYVMVGLTSAGALDTAFGQGGKVVVDLNKSGDNPRNMLITSDGKIMATGYSNIDGVVQPVIVRVSSAGILDSTWGTSGVATAKVLGGVAESYALSPQGSDFILAGYGRGADAVEKVDLIVYRFKANGTWDTSFGKEGVARLDIAKEDDRARNVLVLPDNRILAVGSGKKSALDVDAMMVLLSKDGAIDTSFGESGILISNLGGTADAWYGIALSPDKKSVIVVGYKGVEGSGNDDAAVARVTI